MILSSSSSSSSSDSSSGSGSSSNSSSSSSSYCISKLWDLIVTWDFHKDLLLEPPNNHK